MNIHRKRIALLQVAFTLSDITNDKGKTELLPPYVKMLSEYKVVMKSHFGKIVQEEEMQFFENIKINADKFLKSKDGSDEEATLITWLVEAFAEIGSKLHGKL